jgi:metal-sulfur cluster biosynthetic enzyme
MTERDIREALSAVIDPELGVDIVALGLVYEILLHDGSVRVVMTMTSPMCPLADFLKDAAEAAIREAVPEVHDVEITLVDDPPWDPSLMSEAARKQLDGGA